MSYFEDGGTVPIPFNIIPTPKSFVYLFQWFFKKFFSRTKFARNEAMRTIRVSVHHVKLITMLIIWKAAAINNE